MVTVIVRNTKRLLVFLEGRPSFSTLLPRDVWSLKELNLIRNKNSELLDAPSIVDHKEVQRLCDLACIKLGEGPVQTNIVEDINIILRCSLVLKKNVEKDRELLNVSICDSLSMPSARDDKAINCPDVLPSMCFNAPHPVDKENYLMTPRVKNIN